MPVKPITPEQAGQLCDIVKYNFDSTDDIETLDDFIGQDRALEAVDFGIGIRQEGFNVFITGPEGSGRHNIVRSYIDAQAKTEKKPDDWCYVYNFKHTSKPIALNFPAGEGKLFKKEIASLINSFKTAIPETLNSDAFHRRKKEIEDDLKSRTEFAYKMMERNANKMGIAFLKNEQGNIMFAPMDEKGEVMTNETFNALDDDKKKNIEMDLEDMQTEFQRITREVTEWKTESKEEIEKILEEFVSWEVGRCMKPLLERYKENEKVMRYLESMKEDILEHIEDFTYSKDQQAGPLGFIQKAAPSFKNYEVNLFITHENGKDDESEEGAPIIYEDIPSYSNLIGQIEHQAQMGFLLTDFTMIKPGALHRANGGYLILDARRLLMQPLAWEGLKRALRSKLLKIESMEKMIGYMSTSGVEPEPIPLDIKVVLIGEPYVYYLLSYYDPDFTPLFKVQADFEGDMPRNQENELLYIRLVAKLIKSKELLPFEKCAVARVLEFSSRLAGDGDKLSMKIKKISDLLFEADYLAKKSKKTRVDTDGVQLAVDAAKRRSGRIPDKIREHVLNEIKKIETSGTKVGQINGLSVMSLGDTMFGQPSRITSLVRAGKGEVVDIEREVSMGGPIHSKGVLILSSLLGERFAKKAPLSLHASLVFEQSYGGVDGDSASTAEFCAIMSALSEVPVKQNFAITGAISQKGEVQAIGGVNEKIEGFYDLCTERGLDGTHSIIIPESNVRHLMLKHEIRDSISEGKFHIYSVKWADEALELLTGEPAGEMDADGKYPEDTVNYKVQKKLGEFHKGLEDESRKKAKRQGVRK